MKGWFLAGLLALAFFAVPPADAQIEGDCTIFVNEKPQPANSGGVDQAVPVSYQEPIPYRFESQQRIYHYDLDVLWSGVVVEHREATSASGAFVLEGVLDLTDREQLGVGLYKVEANGVDQAGNPVCAGTIWLKVEGSVLEAPAGILATSAVVIGAVGLLWIYIAIIAQAVDVANEVRAFNREHGDLRRQVTRRQVRSVRRGTGRA